MTRKIFKPLKIALFSVLFLLCLTFVCSASEFSFTEVYSIPFYANEYDIFCNYDALTFSTFNDTINIQMVELSDLGYNNVFVYCSDIEAYIEFVNNYVTYSSDTVQFSQNIIDTMNIYNPEAENLNSLWISRSFAYKLYEHGNNFLTIPIDSYNMGYGVGYSDGTYNGMQESEALKGGLLTILSAPFYVLGGILDFDILGINLLDIFTGLLTLCLFAFVVKKLINGGA